MTMKPYLNKSGKSGVMSYETGKYFIAIIFNGEPSTYIYNYKLTGKKHVEKMKQLAAQGLGLSTYISQHPDVRDNFSKK
jgi:hypothetical protein